MREIRGLASRDVVFYSKAQWKHHGGLVYLILRDIKCVLNSVEHRDWRCNGQERERTWPRFKPTAMPLRSLMAIVDAFVDDDAGRKRLWI